jgi:LacI family repressor for deo operon, udp, cdd, tsx, nupC, and nupG
MRASVREVAALAGVSASTVSNVLNHAGRVSPAVIARVRDAAILLDYRPNVPARMLRNGRSGVIGLAVGEVGTRYFGDFGGYLIQSAATRGWRVLVEQTEEKGDRELAAVEGLRGNLLDGLILAATSPPPLDWAADELPVVLITDASYRGRIPFVGSDSRGLARTAVEHLTALGRRRIAMVDCLVESCVVGLQMHAGYGDAHAAAGLPVHPELTVRSSGYRYDSAAAIRELLRRDNFDAVFCCTDQRAVGVLHALAGAGVRVPDDVAVIGIEDSDEGRYTRPMLTSVTIGKAQAAREAVDLLATVIGRGPGVWEPLPGRIVSHQLIVRQSTAGVAAAAAFAAAHPETVADNPYGMREPRAVADHDTVDFPDRVAVPAMGVPAA